MRTNAAAVEVLVCPRCAGPRRIVGAVTDAHAVRRLLAALRLAPEPPPGVAAATASWACPWTGAPRRRSSWSA